MVQAVDASRGVVLLGHGSRDPLWRQPIEAVAAQMAQVSPTVPVRCAYLELCAPDLASTVAELVAGGSREIAVVPMFLGVGKHAREDLPGMVEQLRAQYPSTTIQLQSAIGERPEMIGLMARLALG